MSRFALVVAFGFAISASCVTFASTQFGSENVVSLTDKDFAERTSDGKLWFIKFFAPWCGKTYTLRTRNISKLVVLY